MRVVPPPARQRSPEHDTGYAPADDAGYAPADDGGYAPADDGGYAQALEEPLAWDHFAVEVTDTCVPVVIHCRGGLDFAYADQLREVFAGITERQVVVDLRRLTFVDSTGLSVLLSARRTLLDVGGTMTIRGASGLVRRVFQAAELADVLDD